MRQPISLRFNHVRSRSKRVSLTVIGTLSTLALAASLEPSLCFAGGVPVIDVGAIAQMADQGAQLAQEVSQTAEQIVLLKAQLESLRGHFGVGAMGAPLDQWAGSSWTDIVAMVTVGTNPGDATQVASFRIAQSRYAAKYPAISVNLQTTNPRLATSYTETYQSAIAGMSAGEAAFNSLNTHLKELQAYKDQIEKVDSVKAALDLNSAVGIKTAQLSAEVLRTNAIQLYLQANAQNAMTNGQAAQSEFFAN